MSIYDPDIAALIQEAKEAGSAPANWEDIKSTLVELSKNAPLLQDTTRCAIYLKQSEAGEIYLTVTGDKVMFDVFGEAAVSYTHLDVYKRQIHPCTLLQSPGRPIGAGLSLLPQCRLRSPG